MRLITRVKRVAMVLFLALLFAIGILSMSGCSELRPTAKSQTLTVLSFGLPAVAFVSETHMAATNSGDDEHTNDFEATNDVKPETDVSVSR